MTFPEGLETMRKNAEARYIPVIRPDAACLLYDTVARLRPRRALEVGTAVGYSGAVILSAYAGVTLTTVELNESRCDEARKNFKALGFSERVRQYRGDAGDVLACLNGGFDFVFLDGPKTRYPDYYFLTRPLLKKGGILFADNVSPGRVSGEIETPRSKRTITDGIARFLTLLRKDSGLETSVYDIGDGIAICKRKD